MPIRLKILKEQEERLRKIGELMNRWKVPTYPTYNYQPVGGSSLMSNPSTVTIDPKIQVTKNLFQMFGIDR
ncbi:MAG: hypothetical protein WBN72_07410 [Nitrososphaeraceae archaeon]